jgi:outer membrane protein TolC
MLDEEKFLKYNIDLQLISSQIERARYNKNVTLAKYLPVVSIQGSYNWQRGERSFGQQIAQILDTKYYRYGFSASMPLDVNSYNDYESARIDYMKSLVVIDDKKRELKALYEQVMQNLENYNKKIALAEENRQLYATLLDETEGLYRAGYKTEYDVDTLKNSEKIQRINKRIYEIDKQLELLNLYEKLTGEI